MFVNISSQSCSVVVERCRLRLALQCNAMRMRHAECSMLTTPIGSLCRVEVYELPIVDKDISHLWKKPRVFHAYEGSLGYFVLVHFVTGMSRMFAAMPYSVLAEFCVKRAADRE